MLKSFLELDHQLEQYIYLHRFTGADHFLSWLTANATLVSFSLLFLVLLAFFITKKQIYLYAVINTALLIGITALITGSLKLIIKRLRPYEVNDLIHKPLIDSGGFSFPSGHTTEVFTLFFAIWFLLNNKYWTSLFLIWAVIIAYSRMAFGVHYPIDIIGGVTVAWLTVRLWLKYQPLKRWFKDW
jgi:undecaprenyl-diphosphatase